MKCDNCGENISEEQYINFNHMCAACNRAKKNVRNVSLTTRIVELYRDLNSKDKIAAIIFIIVFVTFVIVMHSIFG